MSITPRFGFALEYVSDVEQAKRFYTDVLGLTIQREAPTFVQFGEGAGASFAIASDESVGGGDEPELYWLVDDAEAALRELSAKTEISMPIRELAFGKVFAVKDPAGRPRYLLQLAGNRPSRPAS